MTPKAETSPSVDRTSRRPRAEGLAKLLKFGLVGGLGFVTDTGTLLALVHILALPAALAKTLSFAVAVLVTFELNRRWAFGSAPRGRWLPTFGAYLGVQATGFIVNWLVFVLALAVLPPAAERLLMAAALASLVALVVNYLGAGRLVFRESPGQP